MNGRIYAVGGMQQRGGPTTRVDQYDPDSREWSAAGHLLDPVQEGQGRGMEGFGTSAFALQGHLFVSSYSGQLQRLAESGTAWEIAGKLNEDRFFHRMLPYQRQLILVGGASMQEGKRLQMEKVSLDDLE